MDADGGRGAGGASLSCNAGDTERPRTAPFPLRARYTIALPADQTQITIEAGPGASWRNGTPDLIAVMAANVRFGYADASSSTTRAGLPQNPGEVGAWTEATRGRT